MNDQQLTPTGDEHQKQGEHNAPQAEESKNIEQVGVTPSEPHASSDEGEAKESAQSASETPSSESSVPQGNEMADAGRASKPTDKNEEEAKTEDELLFEAALANLESKEVTTGEPTHRKLSKGDRVEATVIHVEKDRVFVDLGTKSEGVVPLGELTDKTLETAEGHVQVGDKIQVIVLRPESAEGNPIVSKKRADFEVAWENIIQAQKEGRTMVAPVIDRVKGGLVVDIGVRGFVPTSHVGSGKLRNIDKFVGQSLPFKVLEIDKERKKVVLSNRDAEAENLNAAKEKLFSTLQIGDVIEGTVRRLTDYGAFIDLGGIDGLLHISEMSWTRIEHPREVLKEGEPVKVMVLKLDPETSKISLGLRQVLPDPWNLIKENYKLGQKIDAKINRLVQTGAFIKLPEGAEAFLPISEISFKRIKKPADVLTEGQELTFTIVDLRPNERRMVLSLKDAGGIEAITGVHIEEDRSYVPGKKKPEGGRTKRGGHGGHGGEREFREGRRRHEGPSQGPSKITRTPTGGATIGERLAGLKDFFSTTPEEVETQEEAPSKKPTKKVAKAKPEEELPASLESAEIAPIEQELPAPVEQKEEEKSDE